MKNIKYLFFVIVISLMLVDEYLAQHSNKDQIVVIGTAKVEIPADIVVLKITLSFGDRVDGRKAYELHKQAEQRLIALLNKLEIHDSIITYSLLTINPNDDYNYRYQDSVRKIYTTNQVVQISFRELSKYASTQLDLISNGFTTINASFGSSKEIEAIEIATQKAVEQAKLKAEIIAKASGRKIKKITKIMDTEESEPIIRPFFLEYERFNRLPVAGVVVQQLIDIPQNINVSKQVKMILELHDAGSK